MASIGWDENTPADTESLGLADDRIRSLKTSLRQGLAEEHVWPSAGGDVGFHLRGSAKAYVGVQSAVSSSGTDGKLMQTSDTSRLFGVGSGGTSFVGGPTVISAGSFPGTVPQRHYWAEEFGTVVCPTLGRTQVTIPNSGYSGLPYVFVSGWTTGASQTTVSCQIRDVLATSFFVQDVTDSGTSMHYVWRSIGTRVL